MGAYCGRSMALVLLLTGVVLILASSAWRAQEGNLARPLEVDELITLRYYTWAGVQTDGEPRELRRRNDIETRGRPGLRELALGIYCSFGRWTEPNNHIVNSALINLTLSSCHPQEVAVRIPALLGGVVLAVLICALCYWVFPARAAIPLVAICAFWHPYVLQYTQEARLYLDASGLQLLLLTCFARLVRRPASLAVNMVTAGIAVLTFMNVVSMSLYWVFPAYAAMFVAALLPRMREALTKGSAMGAALRTSLAAQIAAVSAVGIVFLIDRLPFVVSSTHQYGVPFQGVWGFVGGLWVTTDYLFPSTGWKLFAGAGVVGLFTSWRQPWGKVLLGMFVASLLVSLAHAAVSQRFPYPRVCGFCLPPILIGFGCLVHRLCEVFTSRVLTGLAWAGCLLIVLVLIAPGLGKPLQDPAFSEFVQATSKLEDQEDLPADGVCTIYGDGVADTLQLYIPSGWLNPGERLSLGDHSCVCVLGKGTSPAWRGVPCQKGPDGEACWDPVHWPGAVRQWGTANFRAILLRGTCEPLEDRCGETNHALVFWYPEFHAVAVDPRAVIDYVNSCGIRYLPIQSRYQAKLSVFSKLSVVIFISESMEEFCRTTSAVHTAIRRFGGEARVFSVADGGDTLIRDRD